MVLWNNQHFVCRIMSQSLLFLQLCWGKVAGQETRVLFCSDSGVRVFRRLKSTYAVTTWPLILACSPSEDTTIYRHICRALCEGVEHRSLPLRVQLHLVACPQAHMHACTDAGMCRTGPYMFESSLSENWSDKSKAAPAEVFSGVPFTSTPWISKQHVKV